MGVSLQPWIAVLPAALPLMPPHSHGTAADGVALSGSTGVLLLEFCAGRDLMSALTVEVAGFPGERLFGW